MNPDSPMAIALGSGSPADIDFSQFVPTNQQTPDILSPLAYYDVPINYVLGIDTRPFSLRIKGVLVQNFAASGTLTRVVNLAGVGTRCVKSPLNAPALPSLYHPDFIAFKSLDNGINWVATNITAIDYVLSTVIVEKDAATNAVKVYYLLGEGELIIRASLPSGYSTEKVHLFSGAIPAINSSEQINQRNALTKFKHDYALAPQMRLEIAVRCKGTIEWSKTAQHEIDFKAWLQPVKVIDRPEFERATLERLRG